MVKLTPEKFVQKKLPSGGFFFLGVPVIGDGITVGGIAKLTEDRVRLYKTPEGVRMIAIELPGGRRHMTMEQWEEYKKQRTGRVVRSAQVRAALRKMETPDLSFWTEKK